MNLSAHVASRLGLLLFMLSLLRMAKLMGSIIPELVRKKKQNNSYGNVVKNDVSIWKAYPNSDLCACSHIAATAGCLTFLSAEIA